MRYLDYLLWACLLGLLVFCGWLRFSHPEKTETELLMDYWPTYLIIVVVAIAITIIKEKTVLLALRVFGEAIIITVVGLIAVVVFLILSSIINHFID